METPEAFTQVDAGRRRFTRQLGAIRCKIRCALISSDPDTA